MPNKKKGGRGGKSKEAAPKDIPKETPEVASPEKSPTIPQYDGPAADSGASPTSPRSPRSPTRVQSPPVGDPALDRPKRFTDICKNVDLAAVMYSLDGLVSADIFIISSRFFTYNGAFHWTRPIRSVYSSIYPIVGCVALHTNLP